MARAQICIFNGVKISVEKAIKIREGTSQKERKKLNFKCIECENKVRPHKAGGNASAHFEHLMRNATCKLSDPAK